MSLKLSYLCLTFALLLALACSDDTDAAADAGITPADKSAPTPDKTVTPDKGKLTSLKVGAVQYGGGTYTTVPSCFDDLCGLTHYIKEAAKNDALVVTTPEYALGAYQKTYEPAPKIGDMPATAAAYKDTKITRALAKLADDENITLTFNVQTQDSAGKYNTLIAVDDAGKVVAFHHKFQLFGNEAGALTPSKSNKESFFDTPAGKTGLLICADVQCIINGMNVNSDCTAHAKTMLMEYFNTYKPEVVLFSAYWTVGPTNGSKMWWALTVQETVAKQGKAWVVASNTTNGAGKGGGIYKPGGAIVKQTEASTPSVIYAELPLKK